MNPLRVGLFGGSFDPVHNAHLALARLALEHLGLDEVIWVPAGHPWQKTRRLAPGDHRLAMVQAAIAGEPRFTADDCELRRPGPSYTLDTVRELAARRPDVGEWFLLLGEDQYAGLPTWQGWPDLLRRVTLVVAAREGRPPVPAEPLRQVPHRLVVLPLPPLAISSTLVRGRLAAGEAVDTLVPLAVAGYIARHRLYLTD